MFSSTPNENQSSISASSTLVSETINGRCFDFECNICLDSASKPVITLCGHLYCWPCIYRWLQPQSSAQGQYHGLRNCPVCKAEFSDNVNYFVPLYGGSASMSSSLEAERRPHSHGDVPRRPPPPKLGTFASRRNGQLRDSDFTETYPQTLGVQHFPYSYMGDPAVSMNTAAYSYIGAVVGMFGNSDMFPCPRQDHSYSQSGIISSRRMRRREMQLERSLNRVSIFLFCCSIVCFLLFTL